MEIEYLIFILLGFASACVSAVFGFGTALLVLALGTYILPVQDTIALATVLFAASTITKTIVYRKDFDWRIVIIMSAASLPFAYLGAFMMTDLPTEWLSRLLGLMILSYVILTRFRLIPSFKIGTPGLIAGSASYGFISGLLGSGNLVKVIIFKEMQISKQAFVGAMAATSVLANVAKLHAYTESGLINLDQIYPMLGLIVAAISAVLLGRRVLMKLHTTHFETGLQIILVVSSIGLII